MTKNYETSVVYLDYPKCFQTQRNPQVNCVFHLGACLYNYQANIGSHHQIRRRVRNKSGE